MSPKKTEKYMRVVQKNGVFCLIFKKSKVLNIRFVGNLFFIQREIFITMTSLL